MTDPDDGEWSSDDYKRSIVGGHVCRGIKLEVGAAVLRGVIWRKTGGRGVCFRYQRHVEAGCYYSK
jgi:hypothetical protein